MAILAIDTTQAACVVAVRSAGGEIVSRREEMRRGHAERVFPMIDAVLDAGGASWPEIERIIVLRGPGSFTGVRVGVALGRALALSTGAPAVGVDAFEALAAGAFRRRPDFDGAIVAFGGPERVFFQRFQRVAGGMSAPIGPIETGAQGSITLRADEVALGPAASVLSADAVEAWDVDVVDILALGVEREATEALAPLYARAPDASPSRHAPPPLLT